MGVSNEFPVRERYLIPCSLYYKGCGELGLCCWGGVSVQIISDILNLESVSEMWSGFFMSIDSGSMCMFCSEEYITTMGCGATCNYWRILRRRACYY
jgi:hypothetical protein